MINTMSGFNRALSLAVAELGLAAPGLRCQCCAGHLRLTARGLRCCPVTAVALHRTGKHFYTGQFMQAAEECGIDRQLVRTVVNAADLRSAAAKTTPTRLSLDRAVSRGIERQS